MDKGVDKGYEHCPYLLNQVKWDTDLKNNDLQQEQQQHEPTGLKEHYLKNNLQNCIVTGVTLVFFNPYFKV